MRQRRILLSLLVSLALLVSLLPGAVLAEPAEGSPEEYGLRIAGVQVTEENRSDVLENGVFSFDGTKTLTLRGSYRSEEAELKLIESSIDGLIIDVAADTSLTAAGEDSIGLVLGGAATVSGMGCLRIEVQSEAALLSGGARLTLRNGALQGKALKGLRGSSTGERLVVDNSNVTLECTEAAVTGFTGGITLVNCDIKSPAGARIQDGSIALNGNPVAALTIAARNTVTNPFTDVSATAWYYPAVLWAISQQPAVTSGVTPNTFAPKSSCSRAEVVQFLWNAAGRPAAAGAENPFSDVKENQWYYKAVLWAVKNGITTGVTPSTFEPKKTCTRAEVVQFLWNAADNPPTGSTVLAFTDVPDTCWYRAALQWATAEGICSGTTSTTFEPRKDCTRAEVVQFLYKAEGN